MELSAERCVSFNNFVLVDYLLDFDTLKCMWKLNFPAFTKWRLFVLKSGSSFVMKQRNEVNTNVGHPKFD